MRILRTFLIAIVVGLSLTAAGGAQPSDVWSLNHNSSPASTVRFWTQSGAGVRAQYVTLADILLGTVATTDRRLAQQVLVGDPVTGATTLGASDDTATFQAAIDYAASLSTFAEVRVPRGLYKVCNLSLKSRVSLTGQYRASELQATSGCTGAVVKLANSSVERLTVANLWIDVAGQSATGLLLDNDGGTFTGADPELRVLNVDVTNAALDGFGLRSRGLIMSGCRSRAVTRDGFSFLAGSTVSMSDGVFTNLSSDASGRDGLHIESVENSVAGMKIGEAGRYGLYLTSGGNWNTLSTIAIDNTGYPSFASGTPVRIETVDNQVDGLLISRGVGPAINLTATSARNSVRATILPVAGGGILTYGALLASGSSGNDVRLTAYLAGSPAMTGAVDPSSDLAANFVTVNGFDYNTTMLSRSTNGSAAKWTTARNIGGNSVDGSANVALANKFIVQGTSDAGLSAAQFLGALATGIVKNTTATGALSIATGADLPNVPIANGGTGQTTAYAAKDALSLKGANIASASTTDLSTATGDFVDVTGTTTITALGTAAAGVDRTVRFTGALTLTHNATSLILPGAANITTANGDVARFRSLGSGNWVCTGYSAASAGEVTAAVSAGTFSTACTAITNVAAIVNRTGQWLRVGNTVTASGACDIDPTTASIRTVFTIALPVASTLAVLGDLGGAGGATTGTVIITDLVKADLTGHTAQVEFMADATAASNTHHWSFTYQVK